MTSGGCMVRRIRYTCTFIGVLSSVSLLSGCLSTSPPEQVCTTWQPTKFQVARIHLDSRSAAHYKSHLSEDPNTFVFSSIIEAQRAGFDMRQEDCDDSMCLSVKQVNDGPSRTQCRAAGVKTMTQCRDGTISTSTGSGTCSHHGGVMY